MDDHERNLALLDLRTGRSVAVPSPSYYILWGFGARLVSQISPDRRYALFRFSGHGTSPQVLDLWVLDLTTGKWLHPPGMPVYSALKYTSETWAPDGRLVIVGAFDEFGPGLAIWRPHEPQMAVRSFPLPEGTYDHGLGDIFVW